MPKKMKADGFTMVCSHSDSPALKLKHMPERRVDGKYTTLNVEPYGGMNMATWLDTPLSVAGRVYVETPKGVKSMLVNIERDLALIPNMSTHQNKGCNDGYK